MKLKHLSLTLVFSAVIFSCSDLSDTQLVEVEAPQPRFMDISSRTSGNASGRTSGRNYGILMVEYITAGNSEEMGNTAFFKDLGNKQLEGDFVPALALDGTSDVSYYIDDNRPSSNVSISASSNAIGRAMSTWDNEICSELGMTQIASDGRATGLVAAVFGFGGSFDYVADVIHNGWMGADFFDILAPGGSEFILGATFTIVFQDENGNLIDTDNNRKFDVAWREIYYNDNFLWNDGSTYDVETIALHEAGHGLSQGHFGKAFVDAGQFRLHFSPRAVMNAAYSGVQTQIQKTDQAGHCSNWAEWPRN